MSDGDVLLRIKTLFQFALENQVTDLFISAGKSPSCRVGKEIRQVEFPEFSSAEIDDFRNYLLSDDGREKYEKSRGIDLSYSYDGQNRFRLNFFDSVNGSCFAARPIGTGNSLDFEKLGLAEQMRRIALLPRGLVLITGSTGSGKTTTLNAVIDYINNNCRKHILTLEDPIEYIHQDKKSLISQREIDSFSGNFSDALKNALRESPDVIVIGEMRDLETMQIAISAAQTGHLVFSTLHTSDAVSTVKRLVNMCPESSREALIFNLSQALEAVVSQRLLPRADGTGLIPAQEILLATPTVKNMIEKKDIAGLEQMLRTGDTSGMQDFNTALFKLVQQRAVTREIALQNSSNPDELKMFFQNIGVAMAERERAAQQSKTLDNLSMRDIFAAAVNSGASDFLLAAGSPPVLAIRGQFVPMELPALDKKELQRLIFSVIGKTQRVIFEETKELDFAVTADLGTPQRFRLNAFFQRGTPAMVGRLLSGRIPAPAELFLPPALSKLMLRRQGLVLITGPTGSGKTTTLASLINELNATENKHIICIEDPVEYVFENKRSYIEQRELGRDTLSFAAGVRAAMRQAPHVIMVGELRDNETIAAALSAAETGHLVLATLHSNSAAQTVERIIDVFPAAQQNQIRVQLANVIAGVVAQRLLPLVQGGRRAAFEVLLGVPAVQALIRDNKIYQLQSVMETNQNLGMQTMEKSFDELVNAGLVNESEVTNYRTIR